MGAGELGEAPSRDRGGSGHQRVTHEIQSRPASSSRLTGEAVGTEACPALNTCSANTSALCSGYRGVGLGLGGAQLRCRSDKTKVRERPSHGRDPRALGSNVSSPLPPPTPPVSPARC